MSGKNQNESSKTEHIDQKNKSVFKKESEIPFTDEFAELEIVDEEMMEQERLSRPLKKWMEEDTEPGVHMSKILENADQEKPASEDQEKPASEDQEKPTSEDQEEKPK